MVNKLNSKKVPFKEFWPGIAWFFVICFLVFLPGKDVPEIDWLGKMQIDKLIHAGMFGSLIFLFCLPFFKVEISLKRKINYLIRICLAAIVWGITIEFIQKYFIPGRSFELLDWAADSTGVIIAFFFCKKIFIKFSNKIPAKKILKSKEVYD